MKKMFKILTLLLVVLGLTTLSLSASAEETEPTPEQEPTVSPEEVPTPEQEEVTEEIVYPCNILEPVAENGIITFSKTGGEVGEVVEVYYTADLLYDLVEITANGIVLTPNEYGVYSFALLDGNNVVTAKFEVSEEKLQKVAELLNQAKEGNWEEIFSLNNLLQLGSWLITIFCSSGFFITLYKSKKYKQLTPLEIAKKVDEKIDEVLDKKLSNFLENVFGPFTKGMIEKFDKMESSTKTMVRCFILMQENTPESRLAILNELNNLNNNETGKLTSQIKDLIAEEVRKQEEKTKAFNDSITDLRKEASDEIPHL